MQHLINITHLRTLLAPYSAQSLMDKLLRENAYSVSKIHTYKVKKHYKQRTLRNVDLYEAINTLSDSDSNRRSWNKELQILIYLLTYYKSNQKVKNTTDEWDKIKYAQISCRIGEPRYKRKTKEDKAKFLAKWNRYTYTLWQDAAAKVGKDELL